MSVSRTPSTTSLHIKKYGRPIFVGQAPITKRAGSLTDHSSMQSTKSPTSSASSFQGLPDPTSPSLMGSLKRSNTQSSPASSESASPEFQQAVEDAANKPFGEIVSNVRNTTSGARSIMGKMTIAGLGVALGLLFAHQPFAVVLVIPAFTMLGIAISYVMRKYINSAPNPNTVAFKLMMQYPTPEEKAHPDFAEAQKLYAFLTQDFKELGKAHLKDMVGKLQNMLSPKPVAMADQPAQAGETVQTDKADEAVQTGEAEKVDVAAQIEPEAPAATASAVVNNESSEPQSKTTGSTIVELHREDTFKSARTSLSELDDNDDANSIRADEDLQFVPRKQPQAASAE